MLGKAMEVASTSPDTGQQGGCTLACDRDAQVLSGTTVRVFAGSYRHECLLYQRAPVALATWLCAPVDTSFPLFI